VDAGRVGAVILAAGASSRFGGTKLLAPFRGRPLLQHVLDAVVSVRPAEIVVVLAPGADELERIALASAARVVVNPAPEAGLASSLQVGLAALGPRVDAALIALGDQPRVQASVIQALAAALEPGEAVAVLPRYAAGGGANPVLLGRAAWHLAGQASGDRGLGPVLRGHPELVREVRVEGANPDVDTAADLAALSWGERVRANREQVDRVRELPDEADFYAPLVDRFRDDPRRTDDPALDVLRSLVVAGETWLDIGAGAGRYALPVALVAGQVIALDPSPGMLAALREGMDQHGIANIRVVEARWPPQVAGSPVADVALIANLGHDIEGIGEFLDAMEASARRLCVAVLMERQPASIAERYWPAIHGEERIALPALPEFVSLLQARGAAPQVTLSERAPRSFPDEDALVEFIRGQLWIAPGGPLHTRLRDLVHADVVATAGGCALRGQRPTRVGVVTWRPGPG
jgi:CTP:molybdopterin cytidylyltransferase MocA